MHNTSHRRRGARGEGSVSGRGKMGQHYQRQPEEGIVEVWYECKETGRADMDDKGVARIIANAKGGTLMYSVTAMTASPALE
jgi:hypothetical protein